MFDSEEKYQQTHYQNIIHIPHSPTFQILFLGSFRGGVEWAGIGCGGPRRCGGVAGQGSERERESLQSPSHSHSPGVLGTVILQRKGCCVCEAGTPSQATGVFEVAAPFDRSSTSCHRWRQLVALSFPLFLSRFLLLLSRCDTCTKRIEGFASASSSLKGIGRG